LTSRLRLIAHAATRPRWQVALCGVLAASLLLISLLPWRWSRLSPRYK